MAKRRKSWTITEMGVTVRIYLRKTRKGQAGDVFWTDVRGEEQRRQSTKTNNRIVAEQAARERARKIARENLNGVTPAALQLGHLFSAYNKEKASTLKGSWKVGAQSRQRLFLAVWGDDMPVAAIDGPSVQLYCETRRAVWEEKQKYAHARTVARLRAKHDKDVKRGVQPAEAPFVAPALTIHPLRPGALHGDFRWLSSVLNWAGSKKTRNPDNPNERLLPRNPLHDCRSAIPREKKARILRPRADRERYERTIEQADAIDPMGRFKMALVLAWHTGHRISAILHLRASDVLTTPEQMRAALAAAGLNEARVSKMPHGALVWRAEHDKQGVCRVTPVNASVRAELEVYLAMNPREGDAWLLPSVKPPKKGDEPMALPRTVASKWLVKAEQRAGLPKLNHGLWHVYRRAWATARDDLPIAEVMEAGAWNNDKALRECYQGWTDEGQIDVVSER